MKWIRAWVRYWVREVVREVVREEIGELRGEVGMLRKGAEFLYEEEVKEEQNPYSTAILRGRMYRVPVRAVVAGMLALHGEKIVKDGAGWKVEKK